jgi:hypothetical protein
LNIEVVMNTVDTYMVHVLSFGDVISPAFKTSVPKNLRFDDITIDSPYPFHFRFCCLASYPNFINL